MSVSRKRELRRNSSIIAISTLGSKAISFVLAPLYSYYLTVEQYGQMDIILTTVGLMFPFISLNIHESTFRFASEKKYDSRVILSSTLGIIMIEGILLAFVVTIIGLVSVLPNIVVICICAAWLDSIFCVLSQFSRGRGNMKTYAFSGILNSVIILILNLLLMVLMKYHLIGWIVSFLVAKVVTIIYLICRIGLKNFFSFSNIDKEFLRIAFAYSVPLVPSASMWWIMNASDRYMLSVFACASVIGIYAVANKIPAFLSVFESIFLQAWQTSAIKVADEPDRDEYYSKVFGQYMKFLTVGAVCLLAVLKHIMRIFENSYQSAWCCSSILVVGVMIHALSGNVGSIYTVAKDTKGALKTTTAGAMVNIIFNAIFIPLFGMVAAATTTVLGYLVVLILRIFDVRKYANITIDRKDLMVSLVFIIIQIFMYYMDGGLCSIIQVLIAVLSVWVYKPVLLGIIRVENDNIRQE